MSIEEIINSERVLNDLGIWQKEVIARVMQNYADQEAIAFAEFLKNNYITGITTGTNDAVWLSIHVNDENEYTEEQLYKLLKKQK